MTRIVIDPLDCLCWNELPDSLWTALSRPEVIGLEIFLPHPQGTDHKPPHFLMHNPVANRFTTLWTRSDIRDNGWDDSLFLTLSEAYVDLVVEELMPDPKNLHNVLALVEHKPNQTLAFTLCNTSGGFFTSWKNGQRQPDILLARAMPKPNNAHDAVKTHHARVGDLLDIVQRQQRLCGIHTPLPSHEEMSEHLHSANRTEP